MKNRSANLLLFILIGCLLMTAQKARAQQQQPSTDSPRNALAAENCRTLVTVTGAVRTAIHLEMHRQVRLLEALVHAGGVTEHAERAVQIVHLGPESDCENGEGALQNGSSENVETYNLADMLRGDEKANPFLQPGDKVVVDSIPDVYVMGHVATPKAIMLKGQITVTQAIKMAGGVLPDSITDRVRIIHPTPDGYFTAPHITVDLKAIRKKRAEDIALQPYDVVEVPGKGDHPSARIMEHLRSKRARIELPALPLRVIY